MDIKAYMYIKPRQLEPGEARLARHGIIVKRIYKNQLNIEVKSGVPRAEKKIKLMVAAILAAIFSDKVNLFIK